MWTFHKLVQQPPACKPIEFGWLLVIDSLEAMIIYNMEMHTSIMASGYSDYVSSKEYQRNIGQSLTTGSHPRQPISWALSVLHGTTEKSLMQILDDLNVGLLRTQHKLLDQFGMFYVQRCGSMVPPSDTQKVLATLTSDKLVFPEAKDVRYLKWPAGTHWYAKVGDVDIVVDGKQKWDTKGEAERAVAIWLGGKA